MLNKIVVATLLASSIFAAAPALDSITKDDFNKISKEFSANFVHSAVTPATKLGEVFGVEVGVIAGVTKTPDTEKVAKKSDTGADLGYIPHAAIMAHVAVPLGFSFEATLFPKQEFSGVEINTFSAAAKYNYSPIPLLDLQARLHFGMGDLSYKTSSKVSSVPVDSKVEFETSSYGLNVVAGTSLVFVKPYLGIGYVKSSSELGVDASSGTIFDSTFTTGKSAKNDESSAHIFAGVEFDLFLIHLGLEYARLFGTEKASMKLSFAF